MRLVFALSMLICLGQVDHVYSRVWDQPNYYKQRIKSAVLLEFDGLTDVVVLGSTAAGPTDGKEIRIPRKLLSKRDQDYVAEWRDAAQLANRGTDADAAELKKHLRSANADIIFDLGIALVKEKDFDDAEDLFSKCVTSYEDVAKFRKIAIDRLAASLMNRSMCLLRTGRENAALTLIRKAIQLEPKTPYIYASLQLIKSLMPEQNQDDVAELMNIAPANPQNLQVRGLVFLSRRDPTKIAYVDTTCLICDGKRFLACPACHGSGKKKVRGFTTRYVPAKRGYLNFPWAKDVDCEKCSRGKVPCGRCRGTGNDSRLSGQFDSIRHLPGSNDAGFGDQATTINTDGVPPPKAPIYERIKHGMTVADVNQILGPGVETMRTTIGATSFSTFNWQSGPQTIIATFSNGLLSSKFRIDLNHEAKGPIADESVDAGNSTESEGIIGDTGAKERSWKSIDGRSATQAAYAGLDAGQVRLIVGDREIEVPLNKLSDSDKAYVFSMVERERTFGIDTTGTRYIDKINELK